jgi:hypothetical protein
MLILGCVLVGIVVVVVTYIKVPQHLERRPAPLRSPRRALAEIQILDLAASIDSWVVLKQFTVPPEPEQLADVLFEPFVPGEAPLYTNNEYPGRRLIDPWGAEYVYVKQGKTFELMSYGSDRAPGGTGDAEDIVLSTLRKRRHQANPEKK